LGVAENRYRVRRLINCVCEEAGGIKEGGELRVHIFVTDLEHLKMLLQTGILDSSTRLEFC
jgi:hypothetical protein